MLWVGLTGGLGTGKSTAAEILRQMGVPVVDADQLAREVVAPGTPGLAAVINRFGSDFLLESGELDRRKLGAHVAADPPSLRELEAILHPLIQELAKRRRHELERQGVPLAIYDVPLLFERNLVDRFDRTIVVFTSEAQQRQRIRERDGKTDKEIDLWLAQQMPLKEKIRQADYVIDNSGTPTELKKQLEDLVAQLTEMT